VAIRVRRMTAEESETIKRLANSRTEGAAKVERAKTIWLAHEGKRVPAIARELGRSGETIRQRIKRFNDKGVDALEDAPRSGRPWTYTAEQVGEVIAAALSKPADLGLPFASWTLDRLESYLNEVKLIDIKRSRIDEILIAEGLRWRKQESWFGERVGPEFAEKRGLSRGSTPTPRMDA
jgi:transposase